MVLDRSENDEVNIKGLPEYQMPSAFVQDNEYVLDNDDELLLLLLRFTQFTRVFYYYYYYY